MRKPKFITLYGKKRSGKNTVAKAIRSYIRKQKILRLFGLGKKIQWKVRKEASFAKPLRQIIGILYDIPDEILYDDSKKNTLVNVMWEDLEIDSDKSGPMTLRELLQALGTDLFREKWSRGIWAQIPFRKDYFDNSLILITDSRFENELRMTRKHQGINIHIIRPGKTQTDTHASENQEIPEELFDFTIIGKEGIPALTMQVYKLLDENFERIFG
jgi:hypothetical protein